MSTTTTTTPALAQQEYASKSKARRKKVKKRRKKKENRECPRAALPQQCVAADTAHRTGCRTRGAPECGVRELNNFFFLLLVLFSFARHMPSPPTPLLSLFSLSPLLRSSSTGKKYERTASERASGRDAAGLLQVFPPLCFYTSSLLKSPGSLWVMLSNMCCIISCGGYSQKNLSFIILQASAILSETASYWFFIQLYGFEYQIFIFVQKLINESQKRSSIKGTPALPLPLHFKLQPTRLQLIAELAKTIFAFSFSPTPSIVRAYISRRYYIPNTYTFTAAWAVHTFMGKQHSKLVLLLTLAVTSENLDLPYLRRFFLSPFFIFAVFYLCFSLSQLIRSHPNQLQFTRLVVQGASDLRLPHSQIFF